MSNFNRMITVEVTEPVLGSSIERDLSQFRRSLPQRSPLNDDIPKYYFDNATKDWANTEIPDTAVNRMQGAFGPEIIITYSPLQNPKHNGYFSYEVSDRHGNPLGRMQLTTRDSKTDWAIIRGQN